MISSKFVYERFDHYRLQIGYTSCLVDNAQPYAQMIVEHPFVDPLNSIRTSLVILYLLLNYRILKWHMY